MPEQANASNVVPLNKPPEAASPKPEEKPLPKPDGKTADESTPTNPRIVELLKLRPSYAHILRKWATAWDARNARNPKVRFIGPMAILSEALEDILECTPGMFYKRFGKGHPIWTYTDLVYDPENPKRQARVISLLGLLEAVHAYLEITPASARLFREYRASDAIPNVAAAEGPKKRTRRSAQPHAAPKKVVAVKEARPTLSPREALKIVIDAAYELGDDATVGKLMEAARVFKS